MALYHSTVNGPVEVKKHQLMGPVGYTVVGSPTITDGVLSNCGASSYLKTSSQIPSNTTEIEGSVVFNCQYLITPDNLAMLVVPNKLRIGTNVATGNFCIRYYENGTSNDILLDTVLQRNTTYKAKFTVSAASISISLYQGNTLLETKTENITYTMPTSGDLRIGQAGDSAYLQYSSIDLNETYIKVNGRLWYYQPAPTKYIIKDNSLVFADQGLYLTGPVNYTKVGSPTVVDGVLGNLSVEDYVKVDSITYNSNSSLEVYTRFKTPTTAQKGFHLITSWGSYSGQIGAYRSSADSNMTLYANVAAVGGTTYQIGFLGNTLALNTWYRAKMSSDNGTWTLTLYEDSGTQLESKSAQLTFGDFTSNINIGRPYGSLNPAMQEIDLKETYIKLDGNLYFYGKNYASKNIAPVPANYTYGTTTTSAIGYVDMRTQQFTAAPSGSVIGRDE